MKKLLFYTVLAAVPVTLTAGALLGVGTVTPTFGASDVKKIEIVAKDKEFKVNGDYTISGMPTQIVLRNEDTVTHGFNSSLFKDTAVKLEGGGSKAEGKGPNVFRVEPGKTMVLSFTKAEKQPGDASTYAFWCDLHPRMKGEMLVIEYKGS